MRQLDVAALVAALASGGCTNAGTSASGSSASPAPTAAAPDRAVRGREGASLAPERLRGCAGFPSPLVAREGPDACGYGGPGVEACVSMAATSSPSLTLITIVIYRGRSRFAEVFPVPSPEAISPAVSAVSEAQRAWRGPRFVEIAAGRRASIEARGLGLGGAITWGTLPSPHATYDLTLVVEWLASDYPVSKTDREALRAIDMPRALACLDAALWP